VSSLRPVRGSAEELLGLLRSWEAAEDPPPLILETSGSTGRPKRVVLSRRALRASADATHARLGGPGRWALSVPPAYVAGLQVLFRSVRAGVDPVLDGGAGTRPGLSRPPTGDRCYVTLVPTQLVRVLADPDRCAELAAFDAVLVGGAPVPPEARRSAETSGIRVVESYGMSETSGGCVYDGHPLEGVAVKVDAEGQVLLAGAVLFDGYDGEPARTEAVLRGGWFRTDDLGHLDHDGRLLVLGRADDMINSGGVKVPALAVEAAVRQHPAVLEAAVVGVPDPEWGERVVAVVTTVGGAPDLAGVRDLVTPRTWAPRGIRVVERLPVLSTGKVDRLAVRRLAADA